MFVKDLQNLPKFDQKLTKIDKKPQTFIGIVKNDEKIFESTQNLVKFKQKFAKFNQKQSQFNQK